MKCSICNKKIKGHTNNAWPYNNGACCTDCDNKKVIPLRLFLSGYSKQQILIVGAKDNSLKLEDVSEELTLKRMQSIVEGYIELVPIKNKDFYFIVNEEGILRELPYNSKAKEIFGLSVVGNLIVCPKNLFK